MEGPGQVMRASSLEGPQDPQGERGPWSSFWKVDRTLPMPVLARADPATLLSGHDVSKERLEDVQLLEDSCPEGNPELCVATVGMRARLWV